MAEFGLFIGWGSPRARKEAAAGKMFEEAVAYGLEHLANGECGRDLECNPECLSAHWHRLAADDCYPIIARPSDGRPAH